MFKQISNLHGDEIYLMVSLWIFLIFFTVVIVMLLTMKKNFTAHMEQIPLDDQQVEKDTETV
ncbi:hypothetical protein M8998_00045 [Sphingobacterium sp. lm-10]|uniref:hypothetical protein n=1 Tax=Sphingobacterium sp. lm-10 TaxID=2944904 RepID=UPI00201FC341|nr:hypothetical protein [Sphingobacterium sp. lm-10]MCL7986322.1 hypothetical protein [Sphingobacterium sp. lm-10]